MKVKLLKKIRKAGRNQVQIHSVTRQDGTVMGMVYGYSEAEYEDLFDFGDTKADVLNKAQRIYIKQNIAFFRKKYRKHSRLAKESS